jgi:hypothetical protein
LVDVQAPGAPPVGTKVCFSLSADLFEGFSVVGDGANHSTRGRVRSHCNGKAYLLLVLASLANQTQVQGDDWPQWRGPDRSNVSRETGLLKSGLPMAPAAVESDRPGRWDRVGFVAGGRLYTTGYRDGGEFVYALNAMSGETIWVTRIGRSINESPRMRWLTQRNPP